MVVLVCAAILGLNRKSATNARIQHRSAMCDFGLGGGELGNAHRKPDAADLVLRPRRQCCQMQEMRMFFRVLQVGVTGFALEIGSGWKAVVYRRRNV